MECYLETMPGSGRVRKEMIRLTGERITIWYEMHFYIPTMEQVRLATGWISIAETVISHCPLLPVNLVDLKNISMNTEGRIIHTRIQISKKVISSPLLSPQQMA